MMTFTTSKRLAFLQTVVSMHDIIYHAHGPLHLQLNEK